MLFRTASNSSLHKQEQEQQDVSETPTDLKESSNDKNNKKQKQSKKAKTEQKPVALDQPVHEIVSSEVLQDKTLNSTINELNVKSSKKAKKDYITVNYIYRGKLEEEKNQRANEQPIWNVGWWDYVRKAFLIYPFHSNI